MTKALSGSDNVKPLFTVYCPQPRRPACPSRKLRRQGRPIIVEKELNDACLEIQNILSGGTTNELSDSSPSVSATSSPFTAFAFLSPSPFTSDGQQITQQQQQDAAEGQSSFPPSSSSSPSLPPSSDPIARSLLGVSHKTLIKKPLRIKLSESVTAIPNLDDISSPSFVPLPSIPAPVPTPPLRSHNPLPYNSPFANRQAPEGIEFGLLSVSPPPLDDEDSFSRFERLARIRRTMWKRHHTDDVDDGAVGSDGEAVAHEDFDMY